jgi:hypothetical protein
VSRHTKLHPHSTPLPNNTLTTTHSNPSQHTTTHHVSLVLLFVHHPHPRLSLPLILFPRQLQRWPTLQCQCVFLYELQFSHAMLWVHRRHRRHPQPLLHDALIHRHPVQYLAAQLHSWSKPQPHQWPRSLTHWRVRLQHRTCGRLGRVSMDVLCMWWR